MRQFRTFFWVGTCMSLALGVSFTLTTPLSAQPAPAPTSNEPVVPITAARTDLELVEKFAKVLETKNRIVRVDGFDPLVLSVSALTPNRIRVSGAIQGVTTLVIYDESGANLTIEVFVKGDTRQLQTIIDKKFPNSSIEAFKVQEAVALRGWVSQPEHITQIIEIAEQFYPKVLNQMKVGGVQQVLLKVRVMEAQRSVIRELGMNFTYLNRSGYVNSSPGAITSLSNVTLPFKPGIPLADVSATTIKNATGSIGIIGDNSTFSSYLTALRDESLLKILAEPEVVVTNGRPATLLSGGEFPILVPQSLGTVSIQWREFGVRLEAVANVLGGGSLRLELQPEVSDKDNSVAVTTNGITVPGLTVRRVNTQVEMKFGQTLMLAGLISNRQTATTHKIPFLGEIPYVGAAFSRKRFDEAETEVVITVTPELVAPLDEGQVPVGGPGRFTDAPTDRELMGYGLVEVPNYGGRCPTCGPGQSGPYIVPGLKDGQMAPSVNGLPAKPNNNELILPPPDAEHDQSNRASRMNSVVGRRPNPPAVRPVGFENPTRSASAPAPDARRSQPAADAPDRAAPITDSRSTGPARNSATSRNPARTTETATNTKNASSNINRKPGLIEPPAR